MSSLKKEKYLTQENKKKKVENWIAILNRYHSNKKEIPLQLHKTALLVIDMQKYFLDSSSHAYLPSGEVIINSINRIVNYFKKNNRPVIFIRYGISDEKVRKISKMKEWWGREELTFSDPLSEIHPLLKVDDSIVIEKSTYDCFIETNLQNVLEELNIEQLVITGVITQLCCETTARSAFCRGFSVWMVIDCLASQNEELHLSSLKAASHGFATPITSDNILKKFNHE
ncbi:MAG: cysteine hydrolase [Candidatus Lokiarchaeota archaeon]|nr:cysteine hydrolase [Candidatus Lokiarchaeota archaeon]